MEREDAYISTREQAGSVGRNKRQSCVKFLRLSRVSRIILLITRDRISITNLYPSKRQHKCTSSNSNSRGEEKTRTGRNRSWGTWLAGKPLPWRGEQPTSRKRRRRVSQTNDPKRENPTQNHRKSETSHFAFHSFFTASPIGTRQPRASQSQGHDLVTNRPT